MLGRILVPFLAMQVLVSATPQQGRSASDVKITSLEQNGTSTQGIGNVAAAGNLTPFGGIGVGCGINWKADTSYGGGLQAGSKDFGLGGGFTIKPDSLEFSAGIGLNEAGVSANVQFAGGKDGSMQLSFNTSARIVCTPATEGQFTILTCKTA
ncbi:hypothetical protein ACJQWK_08791 [Exserohilum turcicum]|uniref:Uncharacterized protein n=1 Tax=Exserohilum turcicum (strain 28A) TaxID=671987 RepID=R0K1E5_EXST2|nr:uncharacterized protein SETTUDRAFT_163068 [Exserohilum turcica Et28A]EOA86978.1 hypothetical protein SETTUDRAFT_163068 [Exserohilum turcica Et28A]